MLARTVLVLTLTTVTGMKCLLPPLLTRMTAGRAGGAAGHGMTQHFMQGLHFAVWC